MTSSRVRLRPSRLSARCWRTPPQRGIRVRAAILHTMAHRMMRCGRSSAPTPPASLTWIPTGTARVPRVLWRHLTAPRLSGGLMRFATDVWCRRRTCCGAGRGLLRTHASCGGRFSGCWTAGHARHTAHGPLPLLETACCSSSVAHPCRCLYACGGGWAGASLRAPFCGCDGGGPGGGRFGTR